MDQKERRKLLGILLINGVFYIQRVKKRKKRRTRRSCLMKEWFIKRDSLSAFNTIFKELHLNDQEYFRQYLRTNTEVCEVKFFKFLLHLYEVQFFFVGSS